VPWGSQGCCFVLIAEGSHAHGFEDAEALSLDCNHLVDSAHIAGSEAAVAIVAAHHICCSGSAGMAAATVDVAEGGVVEEGVASTDPVASEVWSGLVRGVSVALEEALELDLVEQGTKMRLASLVLSDAIRLAEGVLEAVLVAQAHCTVAAVASIARAALLRRRLLARPGSRRA